MAEVPGYKDGVDEGVARFEMKVTGVFEEAGNRGSTCTPHPGGADQ